MTYYAIIENNKVINVIIAESIDIAKNHTGLSAIETTGTPWIDWTFENEEWRPPRPYHSWTWGGQEWIPPIQMPDDDYIYIWDEDNQNWKIVE